jgi:hypothetical protein
MYYNTLASNLYGSTKVVKTVLSRYFLPAKALWAF